MGSEPLILMLMLLMALEPPPRVPDNLPLMNSPLPLDQLPPEVETAQLPMVEPSQRLESPSKASGIPPNLTSPMLKVPSPLPWMELILPPSDKLSRMTPPPGAPRMMLLTDSPKLLSMPPRN